jgi:D-glycero-D-manno-heptose 1,7-bisphosphate phosphatase
LDDDQLERLCEQVPGTLVHADLSAFAEHIIRDERKRRGETGESDSGYGSHS